MPFNTGTGVYTAAGGATNAATGQVIQSAVWNSVHTDFQTALTTLGTLVLPANSGAVWTSYTPSIVSQGGTITTVGTLIGRFYQLGKAVFLEALASITTNGSGSLAVVMVLPTAAKGTIGSGVALFGREDGVTGSIIMANQASVGTGSIAITTGSNAYPGQNGAVIRIGGIYEAL